MKVNIEYVWDFDVENIHVILEHDQFKVYDVYQINFLL